jgi:hypothetical protein
MVTDLNNSTIMPKSRHLRSTVTNGKKPFAIGGDGRGAWTRRWKDLHEAHVADLGDFSCLSEAQISLCKRAATLETELEQLEAKMSEGRALADDLDLYNRLLATCVASLSLLA